jgi:hypothetical protein
MVLTSSQTGSYEFETYFSIYNLIPVTHFRTFAIFRVMKTMFIIPGFKESINDSSYKSLQKFFIRKKYVVKLVPIVWNYRTMTDYIQQFEDFYLKNKGSINYVFGFSYGAVIALSSAQKLGVDRLFL